jgi:predicted MFS family arabinose efflux permease
MALKHDAVAVLRIPGFRRYSLARFLLNASIQIQTVTVGWQIYQITKDPLSLGMAGLAEAIPYILIALYGGHLADILNRKKIITTVCFCLAISSMIFFLISRNTFGVLSSFGVFPIYILIFLTGLLRGVIWPAMFGFWPTLIKDKSNIKNAVTWNSTLWQLSASIGPAIGGLLLQPLGVSNVFLIDASLLFCSFLFYETIPYTHIVHPLISDEGLWKKITQGIRFVFNNEIIIGSISLDLFAVFFGGAVALLPAICIDVLHVGSFEFGLLKAATGVGTMITTLTLAFIPLQKNAGRVLLWAVAGFALCIIGFGFSNIFWISFALLFLSGAFDGVSVIIRGSIMQLYTPENMKGRVSAVNNIFIGSSNELGAFESGLMAKLMGIGPSIVFGGVVSFGVVVLTAIRGKKLRKLSL